ncbi:MAG: hypothetical protein ABWZ25_14560 [Chitinophagaceae bacterium]
MKILSQKDQDLCTYTGVFGCLISAACTIQHLMLYNVFDYALTMFMLFIFLDNIFSFGMLALQKWYAPIWLLICAVMNLLTGTMALRGPLFSVLVILHFIYTATVVVVLYVDRIPSRLRAKELAQQAERNEWAGKI